uniref:CSON009822 protein n=1 Tax=Culicoides sonorensis TaxID=179676 RepID=A0A336M4S9_CULSO
MLSINNYLFDELLLQIFHNLSVHDRHRCRQVCKRWNEILINCVLLMKDFNLYFDDFLTLRDVEILMRSNLHFEKISFGENIIRCLPTFVLHDLWTKLGKTVIEIFIEYCDNEEYFEMLKLFPLLKSLRINSQILDFPEDFKLTNLENLHVSLFELIKNENGLLESFPNSKSIKYDEIMHDESKLEVLKSIQIRPSLWKTLHWFDDDPLYINFQETFLKLTDLQLDHFEYSAVTDIDFLIKVIQKHPGIKNISLVLQDAEITLKEPLFDKITSLEILHGNPFLLPYELINLKSITALVSGFCTIEHTVQVAKSIEELNLHFSDLTCVECYNTLMNNYPNLKEIALYFDGSSISPVEIPKLIQKWKKLVSLTTMFENESSEIILTDHSCDTQIHENLEALVLLSNDIHELGNILQFVPNLKRLEYVLKPSFGYKNLPNNLANLPELRKLNITIMTNYNYCAISKDGIQKTLKAIASFSKKIKELRMPIFFEYRGDALGAARFLFESLPKLKSIRFDSLCADVNEEYFERL